MFLFIIYCFILSFWEFMVFNFVALVVLVLGLFVLFSKHRMKMSNLNLVMSFVVFGLLLFKGYYLTSLVYLTISVLISFEIFLYLTNKQLIYKKHSFIKQNAVHKLASLIITSVLTGVVYIYFIKKTEFIAISKNYSFDVLVVSVVSTLFIISGYIVRSKKWK